MYPPYYGGPESFVGAQHEPGSRQVYDLPGVGGEAQLIGGLGAAQSVGLGAASYGAISVAGAAVGGAVTGYLASGARAGAITGGAFTAGLASIGDAFLFMGEKKGPLAMVFGVLGVGSIGWAFWRFSRRGRR